MSLQDMEGGMNGTLDLDLILVRTASSNVLASDQSTAACQWEGSGGHYSSVHSHQRDEGACTLVQERW